MTTTQTTKYTTRINGSTATGFAAIVRANGKIVFEQVYPFKAAAQQAAADYIARQAGK